MPLIAALRKIRTALWLLCLAGWWLLPLSPLHAQSCGVQGSSNPLGTASSFALQGSPVQAQVLGGINCQSLITLATTSYIRATLLSQTALTGDDSSSTGYSVPFTVYTDTGYSAPLTLNQTVEMDNTTLISLLSQTGVPLYVSTSDANVPAGHYTGSFEVNWQYAVCLTGAIVACLNWSRSPGLTQGCTLVLCGAPTDWGSGSPAQITVTLTVSKSCLIDSAPNVSFGSQPLVVNFAAITQSVTVHCTITEGYMLAFDMGDNASAPWRQMVNGSNVIRYNLYYPGTTTVWNTVNPMSMVGQGGTPIAGQVVSYQAIIDPTQATPPAGVYTDNVRVIVSY